MSKAFTRESDNAPDSPVLPRLASDSLPPGTKNYLTLEGARRFEAELERLVAVDRPRLASASDLAEGRQRLLVLDHRILQLRTLLQSAVVVAPPAQAEPVVRFGATVTVRRADGEEDIYRIVGVDEVDAERGWVSWRTPIARCLLNARVGDRVKFKFPSGEDPLEILRVAYASP